MIIDFALTDTIEANGLNFSSIMKNSALLTVTDFETKADEIRNEVNRICGRYPIYQ